MVLGRGAPPSSTWTTLPLLSAILTTQSSNTCKSRDFSALRIFSTRRSCKRWQASCSGASHRIQRLVSSRWVRLSTPASVTIFSRYGTATFPSCCAKRTCSRKNLSFTYRSTSRSTLHLWAPPISSSAIENYVASLRTSGSTWILAVKTYPAPVSSSNFTPYRTSRIRYNTQFLKRFVRRSGPPSCAISSRNSWSLICHRTPHHSYSTGTQTIRRRRSVVGWTRR